MSDTSPILSLPYILPSQAQKHVTHNEALRRLDMLVQTVVLTRDRTTPPADPAPGDSHIVAPGGQGAWAGQDGALAGFDGQGWVFLPPLPGWKAFVRADSRDAIFDGAAWITQDPGLQNLPGLGVGTQSDATNRLAVAAPAALFSHAGDDHRVTINKAATGDTASLLYQSGWSGRAEIGLTGSEAFTIKVSANGQDWTEALRIAPDTGRLSGAAVQADPDDTAAGRLLTVGGFGLGAGTVPLPPGQLDSVAASGLYHLSAPMPGQLATGASIIHLQSAPDRAVQLAFDPEGMRGYWRHRDGAWSDWQRLYHGGDVLGPVAMSDGQPTGALLERRDTADGHALRFADGTQICHHEVALGPITAVGAGTWQAPYRTAPLAGWTYPAPFAAPPQITGSAVAPAGASPERQACFAMIGPAGTDSCGPVRLGRIGGDATADVMSVALTALGRWA